MEEKKSKKGLIILIVILSLTLIGGIGYFVYDKYFKEEEKPIVKEEPKEEENSFYSVANLLEHKYTKKIESTESGDHGITYIKILDGKVYVLEDFRKENSKFIEAKGIKGTPKSVYYGLGAQSVVNSVLAVLTDEGDLYYVDLQNKYGADQDEVITVPEFEKVNTNKVVSMYKDYASYLEGTQGFYPYDSRTIYLELEDGKLMALNEGSLDKTYEELNTYPDQLCAIESGGNHCDGLVISSLRSLAKVSYDDNGEKVYTAIKYNGQEIKVKDGFSIGELENYKYYIISQDNDLYEISSSLDVKLYKDVKVKDYSYEINGDKEKGYTVSKATITYEDGTVENFDKVFSVSTLYERYNK